MLRFYENHLTSLLWPIADAGIALVRLDGRIARSPVGVGWIERSHFIDACTWLWLGGELVHLEDLVLHDAPRYGRPIPFDQRGHRDRETRLLAIAQGLNAAAEIGLKEHDRLAPTRLMIERKLDGRPTSSKLPEWVMAKPLVSAGMVEKALGVTPPGGAADCGGARLAGDDGEGAVSGVGGAVDCRVSKTFASERSIQVTFVSASRPAARQHTSTISDFGSARLD